MEKNSKAICRKKATRYMKVPLKSTEQVYLIFLIPTLINCIIYITHFSADLVVAIQHYRESNPVWASCTVGLMYTPAITYFVLTVSRPDWWMNDDDKTMKGVFYWFCFQVLQLIAFPLFALYRYAGLIVLSVDAILLSGKERIKTLDMAAAPAAIELYFFLQAWFQAIPQAIFQSFLLLERIPFNRTHQSVVVQVLCILMSIVVIAIETASFQRFESQRVNGRKLPWAMWLKKYCIQELKDLEENVPLQSHVKEQDNQTDISTNEQKMEEATESKQTDKTEHPVIDRQISVTPPLPPKNVQIVPPPTPLRGITTVPPLPVPDVPAPPRPDSIVKASEQEGPLSKPGVMHESEDKSINNTASLKFPKRKYSTKGLEEDDPIGKFLSFLWWFFFIFARVFSIVTTLEFFPFHLLGVLGTHYVAMLIYLSIHTKYYDAISLFVNMWLGLVYIFGAIEYRVKFKYADKWLFPYYTLVILENTFITLFWYFSTKWEGFWYSYIFYAIFISMGLCILSSIVYHVLFKPKKCRVYDS